MHGDKWRYLHGVFSLVVSLIDLFTCCPFVVLVYRPSASSFFAIPTCPNFSRSKTILNKLVSKYHWIKRISTLFKRRIALFPKNHWINVNETWNKTLGGGWKASWLVISFKNLNDREGEIIENVLFFLEIALCPASSYENIQCCRTRF